jgi:hypothetical protein
LFPFAPTNVPNNANSLAACWPLLLALSAIHSENCMPCAGPHLHHLFPNQPVVTSSISIDRHAECTRKVCRSRGCAFELGECCMGLCYVPSKTNNSCDNRNC